MGKSRLFILAPIAACLAWLVTIIGLLIEWAVIDHFRHYSANEASILFISSIGSSHRILFITGTTAAGCSFILSLAFERYLRSNTSTLGATPYRRGTALYEHLSLASGILAAVALIAATCIDSSSRARDFYLLLHNAVLAGASAFFGISTLAYALRQITCAKLIEEKIVQQARHQGKDDAARFAAGRKEHATALFKLAIARLVVVGLGVCVASACVTFFVQCGGKSRDGAGSKCEKLTSAAAVCEWVVLLLLAVLFGLIALDMRVSLKYKDAYSSSPRSSLLKGTGGLQIKTEQWSVKVVDPPSPSAVSSTIPATAPPTVGRSSFSSARSSPMMTAKDFVPTSIMMHSYPSQTSLLSTGTFDTVQEPQQQQQQQAPWRRGGGAPAGGKVPNAMPSSPLAKEPISASMAWSDRSSAFVDRTAATSSSLQQRQVGQDYFSEPAPIGTVGAAGGAGGPGYMHSYNSMNSSSSISQMPLGPSAPESSLSITGMLNNPAGGTTRPLAFSTARSTSSQSLSNGTAASPSNRHAYMAPEQTQTPLAPTIVVMQHDEGDNVSDEDDVEDAYGGTAPTTAEAAIDNFYHSISMQHGSASSGQQQQQEGQAGDSFFDSVPARFASARYS